MLKESSDEAWGSHCTKWGRLCNSFKTETIWIDEWHIFKRAEWFRQNECQTSQWIHTSQSSIYFWKINPKFEGNKGMEKQNPWSQDQEISLVYNYQKENVLLICSSVSTAHRSLWLPEAHVLKVLPLREQGALEKVQHLLDAQSPDLLPRGQGMQRMMRMTKGIRKIRAHLMAIN